MMSITYNPSLFGHSNARRLWEKLPVDQQCGCDSEADVILYDDAHLAAEGLVEYPDKTHILVILRGFYMHPKVQKLPDNVIVMCSDQSALLLLLLALMEIRRDKSKVNNMRSVL